MDEQVEKPVRQHHRATDKGSRPIASEEPYQQRKARGPDRTAQQAVGIGHVIEVERHHFGDPGGDAEILDAGQCEPEKPEIQQLSRDK